jgi:hypothetical protein
VRLQIFVIFFSPNLPYMLANLKTWSLPMWNWKVVMTRRNSIRHLFLEFKYFVSCTLFAPTNVTQCVLKIGKNPTQAQSFILVTPWLGSVMKILLFTEPVETLHIPGSTSALNTLPCGPQVFSCIHVSSPCSQYDCFIQLYISLLLLLLLLLLLYLVQNLS